MCVCTPGQGASHGYGERGGTCPSLAGLCLAASQKCSEGGEAERSEGAPTRHHVGSWHHTGKEGAGKSPFIPRATRSPRERNLWHHLGRIQLNKGPLQISEQV